MSELVTIDERSVTYTPLAETDAIKLTVGMVRNVIAVPTRSGQTPSDRDLMNFVMLCKSRRLNPFVGDAYLVGYDSKDGPTFSLITSVAALRKRAEAHPQFDGCSRGLIVEIDGEPKRIDDQVYFGSGKVLGAWADVHRKDHSVPYREAVKLEVYSTGRSRWAKDPEGMICKVAESAALRRAFPSELAGMYLAEEFGDDDGTQIQPHEARPKRARRTELSDVLDVTPTSASVAEPEPGPQAKAEPQTDDGGPSIEEMERDGLVESGKLFDTSENLGA